MLACQDKAFYLSIDTLALTVVLAPRRQKDLGTFQKHARAASKPGIRSVGRHPSSRCDVKRTSTGASIVAFNGF